MSTRESYDYYSTFRSSYEEVTSPNQSNYISISEESQSTKSQLALILQVCMNVTL